MIDDERAETDDAVGDGVDDAAGDAAGDAADDATDAAADDAAGDATFGCEAIVNAADEEEIDDAECASADGMAATADDVGDGVAGDVTVALDDHEHAAVTENYYSVRLPSSHIFKRNKRYEYFLYLHLIVITVL